MYICKICWNCCSLRINYEMTCRYLDFGTPFRQTTYKMSLCRSGFGLFFWYYRCCVGAYSIKRNRNTCGLVCISSQHSSHFSNPDIIPLWQNLFNCITKMYFFSVYMDIWIYLIFVNITACFLRWFYFRWLCLWFNCVIGAFDLFNI